MLYYIILDERKKNIWNNVKTNHITLQQRKV